MLNPRALSLAILFAIASSVLAGTNRISHTQPAKNSQQQAVSAPGSPLPANPADVSSPDAILAAVYSVISGPAGQKRDWQRFQSLFAPGARLIPIGAAKEGGFHSTVMTPEEYTAHGDSVFAKIGFYEREVARRTEQWGNILQAFSTYESRHDANDSAPFARGINSFQLFNDGQRWWVVTIMWQAETPSTALTPELLQKKN